jgi:hypothetical protein
MNAAARKSSLLKAVLMSLALSSGFSAAAAEYGTSFTYQGSLKASGVPMNGTVNLQFSLYDVAVSGVPLTAPIELNNVPISDGVFTVELDFGALPQSAQERWLSIVVNSTILSPRQKFSPTPLAQSSLNVPLVFGGQIHESVWGGSFATPYGITEGLQGEARAQMVMPKACTAKNLFVRNMNMGSLPNTTATIRVNGVATLLACSQVQANGPTCSNTTASVDIQAGDLVSISVPGTGIRPITNSEAEIRGYVSFSWICE